jgi:glycosyltransferase involved in cell wall biosynthesis
MECMPVGKDMKTALKPQKRAAKKPSTASRAASRTADVLLAARWTAVVEDREAAMLALAGALPEVGVAAQLWRPFEDRLGGARCLHLFGTAVEFLPLVEAARANGLKVVLSPELWHDVPEDGPCGRGWLPQAGAWFRKSARGLFTRTPAWQRELFAAVDLLLPNSQVEAQRIVRRTKVPVERMRVVPHGVDPRLAVADPQPFRQRVGERDFVLYAGAIEPKNQQLGFLWAMKKTDVPLVLVGDVAPNCQWYLEECRRVAGTQARFVDRQSVDERLMASAFTACSCLVVGGGVPAGERIALKAGASGTPLVLFEGGCGSEYFGQQAVYVRPDDVDDIRRGVLAAVERKRSKSLAEHVCTYFSWSAVARATRAAYGRAAYSRGRRKVVAG